MQRIAIIDIGSNSARLVITHIYKNGAYNMVYNQKEALRLSQKIDKNGNLTQQAFTDTIETMKSFAYMCKLYHADRIIAVATAAIRNAGNGAELTRLVQRETGINLHIITGNTELYQLPRRYQHPSLPQRHYFRPGRRQHGADSVSGPQNTGIRFRSYRRSKHHRTF